MVLIIISNDTIYFESVKRGKQEVIANASSDTNAL